ncbi:MAG: MBL fold metallo-hydrolase [Lacibacter sp.]
MKIAVLIDNTPHPNRNMLYEHGLSIYIETAEQKCLLDTGASDKFLLNAAKKGIDLTEVDFVILSHGHADHTGGLEEFLKLNKKAVVYLSSHALNKSFVSNRHGIQRNIGINTDVINQNRHRFVFTDHSNKMITENIAIITNITQEYKTPEANSDLFILENNNLIHDNFCHEQAVVIKTSAGLVIFSGCSHNGILNILSSCIDFFPESTVRLCLGGTHLIDSTGNNYYETKREVENIARTILKYYPDMTFFTGHCTGKQAIEQFRSVLGNKLSVLHTGLQINTTS